MRLFKGDTVEVVHSPYGAMLAAIAPGTRGVVTKHARGGSTAIVSIRFQGGIFVKCWLMKDSEGRRTLKAL